jgi:hypothetical protein
MGSGSSHSAPAPAPPAAANVEKSYAGACNVDQQAFMQCLQQNSGSVQSCDFYFNALQQCQSSQN